MANARIQLEILSGDEVIETKEFNEDRIEIGKISSSTLRLSDNNVSRKHASIQVEPDGRVTVNDMGSTNGTRLNGMRIRKAYLADGDEIEIGVTRLRVRFDDELKKKAASKAPSGRTQLSREGFYRTEERRSGKGRKALEGALLWEDSPIQVETFVRPSIGKFIFAFGAVCILLNLVIAAVSYFTGAQSLLAELAILEEHNAPETARLLELQVFESSYWQYLIISIGLCTLAISAVIGLCINRRKNGMNPSPTFVVEWLSSPPARLSGAAMTLVALSPVFLGIAAGFFAFQRSSAPDAISIGWVIGLASIAGGLALFFVMDQSGWRALFNHGVWLMGRGESIAVGETPDCRFFLPSTTIGGRTYKLIVPHGKGWAVNLERKEVRGDLLHNGKVSTIEEAREQNLIKGSLLPVGPDTKCRLRFGQFSMLLSHVEMPARPSSGVMTSRALPVLLALLGSCVLHVGMWISFVVIPPKEDIQIYRTENPLMARYYKIESIKQQERAEEEEDDLEKKESESKFNDESDELDEGDTQDDPEIVNEDDIVKNNKAPRKKKKFKKPENEQDRQAKIARKKKRAKDHVSTALNPLANLDPNRGRRGPKIKYRPIGSKGGANPGEGATLADAGNTRPGSQGTGNVTWIDRSEMGGTEGATGKDSGFHKDLNKRKDKGRRRLTNVRLKDKPQRAVVRTGRVSVRGGGLDKATIRRHINRQKGAVIRCYKRAVQRRPDLEGTVTVAFLISPTGAVVGPKIARSNLGDGQVEACIRNSIRRWRFPRASNAVASRVRYPFYFRAR